MMSKPVSWITEDKGTLDWIKTQNKQYRKRCIAKTRQIMRRTQIQVKELEGTKQSIESLNQLHKIERRLFRA